MKPNEVTLMSCLVFLFSELLIKGVLKMEEEKSKLDTIRDEEHLERVVYYLNDRALQYREKGVLVPQWTESQNKRMYQEILIIQMSLAQFYTKMKPIKYPKKLKYDEPYTMEALDLVLSIIDEEEKK